MSSLVLNFWQSEGKTRNMEYEKIFLPNVFLDWHKIGVKIAHWINYLRVNTTQNWPHYTTYMYVSSFMVTNQDLISRILKP